MTRPPLKPLDDALADLLAAPAMDFEHDVIGIYNEIDRETGSLGVFQPRYAEVKR